MHMNSQAECAGIALQLFPWSRDIVHMLQAPRPRHFLRQWRQKAGLRLEDVKEAAEALFEDRVVAEGEQVDLGKIGLSHSTLSRIENFKLPYNEALLDVLREVYGAPDNASLIMRNPEDPEGIWTIYDQIAPEQRTVALKVLQGFRTGTDG